MRPLLLLLLFCLLFASCQQRYGHVKKVHKKPVKVEHVQQDEPLETPEELVSLPDSSETEMTSEVPEIMAETQPTSELPLEEPDRPKTIVSKSELIPLITKTIQRIPSQIPLVPDSIADEVPHENLLMVAVFMFWILLFGWIAALLVTIAFFILVFSSVIVISSATAFFETFLLIVLIVLIITVITTILAFFIGRNRIEDRLGYLPPRKALIRNYFIALGVIIVLNLVLNAIAAPIGGAFSFLLFLVAGIYTVVWDL